MIEGLEWIQLVHDWVKWQLQNYMFHKRRRIFVHTHLKVPNVSFITPMTRSNHLDNLDQKTKLAMKTDAGLRSLLLKYEILYIREIGKFLKFLDQTI